MKALIWIACGVATALVRMILMDAGIVSGYGLSALGAVLYITIAQKLCFRWDLHRLARKAKAKGMTVNELVKKATKQEILDHCESLKDRKELKSYLKQQLEWGTITKLHMKVLFDHYK